MRGQAVVVMTTLFLGWGLAIDGLAARRQDTPRPRAPAEPSTKTPRLEVTSPLSGAVFPPSSTILFTVDADPRFFIGPLKLFRGSTLVGEVGKPPYVLSVSDLPEGEHEFHIEAMPRHSAAPKSVTSAPVKIVIKEFSAPAPSSVDMRVHGSWIEPTEFPQPRQPFTIHFTFVRAGPPADTELRARLILEHDHGIVEGPLDVSIDAGADTGSVSWTINGLVEGDYRASIHLDADDRIVELNERNNQAEHAFRVGPGR